MTVRQTPWAGNAVTDEQRKANAVAFKNAALLIRQRHHEFLLHGSNADNATHIEAKRFVVETLEQWAAFLEKVR